MYILVNIIRIYIRVLSTMRDEDIEQENMISA